MNIKEFGSKIEVSIGLVVFLIVASWFVSDFYHNQITLEERMDKRYDRIQEKFKQLHDEGEITE